MAKVVKTVSIHSSTGLQIIAKCDDDSITTYWDIELSIVDNHKQAAQSLIASLDWKLEPIYRHSDIVSGELKDCYYHVLVP